MNRIGDGRPTDRLESEVVDKMDPLLGYVSMYGPLYGDGGIG